MANRKKVDRALDPRIQQQVVRHHVLAQLAILAERTEFFGQASDAVGHLNRPRGPFY